MRKARSATKRLPQVGKRKLRRVLEFHRVVRVVSNIDMATKTVTLGNVSPAKQRAAGEASHNQLVITNYDAAALRLCPGATISAYSSLYARRRELKNRARDWKDYLKQTQNGKRTAR